MEIDSTPQWNRRFALLPTRISNKTIWLQWYWVRFAYTHYECLTEQQAAMPVMREAFRVTEVEGGPTPRYHMRFSFGSYDDMVIADVEWRALCKTQ